MALILVLGNARQSFCPGPPWGQEHVHCFKAFLSFMEKHGQEKQALRSDLNKMQTQRQRVWCWKVPQKII